MKSRTVTSGKQYSLNFAIIEPGENKFFYHLTDDTNHDSVLVHEVLEIIFQRWDIKNETAMIKSENASNRYKNKYAFQSILNVCNKYNVRMIRTYGAADHGKGLIDVMFSFGVKRKDIVTDDCLKKSSEICEYFSSRCNSRISYVKLDARKTDEKRSNKKDFKIKGCMTQLIFEYLPHSKTVYNTEYLCKCEECINLNYPPCLEESKELTLMKLIDSFNYRKC